MILIDQAIFFILLGTVAILFGPVVSKLVIFVQVGFGHAKLN
jgi:hypothetical protein